jgi:hypothetical protein
VIGVLGGYGAVGAEAAKQLHAWGIGPLRLGGRDLAAARRCAAELAERPARGRTGSHERPTVVEARAVDLDDAASLTAFARGCDVIVDCTGRTAHASPETDAHLVSAGGVRPAPRGDRSAVFAAGAVPGLSGLLPRWLAAQGFDTVGELTAYTAVLDRFTPSGAADFLSGVLDGSNEPLAAWRAGGRRSGALTRRVSIRLPYVPREVSAYPFLDGEGEQLAKDLSLIDGSWYTVQDGAYLSAALDIARTADRESAIAGLCRASALDVAGRTPYVTYLVQLDGTAAGLGITRTAVLRGSGIAELTGAVTAAATVAVLQGEVADGSQDAATALDPVRTVDRLRDCSALRDLTVFDASIDDLVTDEEGAL